MPCDQSNFQVMTLEFLFLKSKMFSMQIYMCPCVTLTLYLSLEKCYVTVTYFFCVCLNVKRQQINLTFPTLQRLEREQEQILVFFPIPLLSRRLWSSFGLSEGLQNIDQSRAYQILGRSVQESSRCHVEKRTVEQRPSAESSKRTYLFDSRISFRVWENPLASGNVELLFQ